MKQCILLAIHTDTFYPELSRVAAMLAASSQFEPILIFPHFYPRAERDIATALGQGWVCLDGQGQEMKQASEAPSNNFVGTSPGRQWVKRITSRLGLEPLVRWLLKFIHRANHREFDNLFYELWYIPRRTRFIRGVIRRFNISLVVVGGDLVHYDTANFIQAAHREGIRAAIVPCTMSDEIEMAISYAPIKNYTMRYFWNGLVAPFFPHWVYEHKGQKLLRLPAGRLLALEALRLAPPKPWINMSGYADVIAAESPAMVDYYTRHGIPESQIQLIGTLADDVMFQHQTNAAAERRELYAQYKLNEKPMLLCALPPDQLYMVGGNPNCDFSTYHALVKFWLETLTQYADRYNVIVNLHPSLMLKDFQDWNARGLTIVSENVTALIPLCQFFVASVSTVIRWAIATGKPVVNYDVYRYRYHDYDGLSAVITMEDQRVFQSTVDRLANEPEFFQQVSDQQAVSAKRWGVLDGQVTQRMLKLFSENA